jgi:pimeloyl-ACP methyl ester carboxylesterase
VPRFGSRDYKNAGALRGILVKAVNEDATDVASKISNPTLLLWGELDQETPIWIGRKLNELIANSKLIIMPGKDHFPFLGSGAHLCAKHILGFIDTLGSSTNNNPSANGSKL